MKFRTFVIILCYMSYLSVSAQEWPKIFWEYYSHKSVRDIKEDYDKGYLLAGFNGWNTNPAEYAIVTKTDINGNILWKKTFGDSNYGSAFYILHKTNDNGSILSGSTTKYDDLNFYKDPLFLKLNSCGELEWCTVLQSPNNNYATGVVPLADGNYIGMLKYHDGNGEDFRISLVKLNQNGHPLWIQHLAQEDSLIRNEEGYDLKVTSDGNYLVTGACPYNGEKAFWIMTDSTGQEIWNVKWDLPDSGRSAGFETFESQHSLLYTAGGMLKPPGITFPALFKLDLEGNLYFHKYLLGDTITGGGAQSLCIYNDTTLLTGILWRNTPGYDYGYSAVLKTDTMGNLLAYRTLLEKYYGPENIIKTHDDKILVAESYYHAGLMRIYLFKLNSDLEDDSIYTRPYTYDSLCDHTIVSDTTDFDCWLHVSIDDIPLKEDFEKALKIWPNPAYEQVEISYESKLTGNKQEETVLEVFDVYGRKVETYIFSLRQSQISLNTTSYKQGIYIVAVKRKDRVLGVGRFVVAF